VNAKEEKVAVLRGLGLRTLSCDEATFMVDYTMHFLLSLKPFDMCCEFENSKGSLCIRARVTSLSLRFSGVWCLDFMTSFHPKLKLLESFTDPRAFDSLKSKCKVARC